jgi:hypothetical protein
MQKIENIIIDGINRRTKDKGRWLCNQKIEKKNQIKW